MPRSVKVVTRTTRNGQTLSVTTGLSATDIVGETTRYSYYKDGQLKAVTDALNHEISAIAYDRVGRIAETSSFIVFGLSAARDWYEQTHKATRRQKAGRHFGTSTGLAGFP